MLYKGPQSKTKKLFWSSIKLIVFGELAAFTGFSIFWVTLAKSREFRFQLYENCPMILNAYYKFDDKVMKQDEKKQDYKKWGIELD